ncbi:uncharacterized protein RDI95_011803 [Morus bassanus]
MARTKAPQRRHQGASKGSLGSSADQQPAGEAAGPSRCQTSRNLCVEVELVTVSSTSAPSSATQGPAKWRDKIAEIARTVFSLARHPAGALVSLWRHLLGTRVFAVQKMAPQRKRFLKVFFLWLPVALAAVYCGTSLPAWTMQAKGLIEVGDSLLTVAGEITGSSAATRGDPKKQQLVPCLPREASPGKPRRLWQNLPVLWAEETQKMQCLLEKVAQLRARISKAEVILHFGEGGLAGQKPQESTPRGSWWGRAADCTNAAFAPGACWEAQEAKPAASEKALEAYVEMSDWALESSGATIDRQRTSETYSCKENWGCRALWFFRTAKPPETILQPDVSPGNCWPLQGHQGQVVIRLPARVHPTAVTVQHIYKDVSPSGTVISAPRDVAVFGVEADGEEETLLGTFTYNVAKEAIQTFPLKNAPLPRAFLYIKLLVKSNWGNPAYTCIYRVQVHGKMAQPESLS